MESNERQKQWLSYENIVSNTPYISARDFTMIDVTGANFNVLEGYELTFNSQYGFIVITTKAFGREESTFQVDPDKLPKMFLIYE